MRSGLILREALNGLRRNASMVVSVVLVTFVSLTFVGTATLMQMQIGKMKGYWYDRAQVAVYMCIDDSTAQNCSGMADDTQLAAVKAALNGPTLSPFIKDVTFVTQDEAFAQFQEQFAGNPAADFATPAMLNETFWVNLNDPSQSDVIKESMAGMEGVESVVDQRAYLDQIFSILNAASYTAVGIAAVMLIAAALLIATTIRLSAFSRRREIGIMRLVGASNGFIQTPFVLEGVFAALIGSLLAGGAVIGISKFFIQGYLAQHMTFTAFVTVGESLVVVPILLVVGGLLAAISANIAISRYLKV